jgi:hypothetical protein
MKRIFKGLNVPKSVLIITILFFTVVRSNGQQGKHADNGYVPINGIKVYYKVYGKGRPIILIHGAFMTIGRN